MAFGDKPLTIPHKISEITNGVALNSLKLPIVSAFPAPAVDGQIVLLIGNNEFLDGVYVYFNNTWNKLST
jgi:hypothetical protein